MPDFVEKDFEQRLLKNEFVKRIVIDFCDSFVQYIDAARDVREKTVSVACYFSVTAGRVYFFRKICGLEEEFGWFNFSINRYPNLSLEESKVMAQVLANESVALLKERINSERTHTHNDTNVRITKSNPEIKKAKSSDFSIVSCVKYSAKNGCYEEFFSW